MRSTHYLADESPRSVYTILLKDVLDSHAHLTFFGAASPPMLFSLHFVTLSITSCSTGLYVFLQINRTAKVEVINPCLLVIGRWKKSFTLTLIKQL
jgi:hypothetical protein